MSQQRQHGIVTGITSKTAPVPVAIGRLAGTVVLLGKIKKAISKHGAFKVSQREFCKGRGLDQGHVSRMLNGKSNVQNGVVVFPPAFERLFLQECVQRAITIDTFAAPVGTASNPYQGIADALGNVEVVDQPEPVLPDLDYFPMDLMQKVALIIRDGAITGEISMTFSLRALIKCSLAYQILRSDADLDHWPTLSAAFWLTKVYGADEEGRRFLLEAYQRIFAAEAPPPEGLIPHREDQHPGEVLVELLARRGFPVWSFGKTGEGKTYANKRIAEKLSSTGRFHRFQGDRDKTASDFIGDLGAHNGTTHRVDGPLTAARRSGEPLIVDEVCICDPSVLMCLQAVLEGDNLSITGSYHEVVTAAPGHLILVTDNSRGLGECVEYVGIQAINEATRDRFYFVEFGSMDPQQELRIAESEAALGLPPVIGRDAEDSAPAVQGDDGAETAEAKHTASVNEGALEREGDIPDEKATVAKYRTV